MLAMFNRFKRKKPEDNSPSLGQRAVHKLSGREPALSGEDNQTWQTIQRSLNGLSVNSQARRLAREVLQGRSKDARAVPGLIEILRGQDNYLALSAARALGELADVRAIPALSQCLLSDERESLREASAWALGTIHHVYAVNALEQALHDDNFGVRLGAIWALKQIGGQRVIHPLLSALDDEYEKVRRHAILALNDLRLPGTVHRLQQALGDDVQAVAVLAAQALVDIGTPEALAAVEAWNKGRQDRESSPERNYFDFVWR
jgi:bilin biosynthesis protein